MKKESSAGPQLPHHSRSETDSLAPSQWIIHDTVLPHHLVQNVFCLRMGKSRSRSSLLIIFLVNVRALLFPSIQNIQDGIPQAEQTQSDSRL